MIPYEPDAPAATLLDLVSWPDDGTVAPFLDPLSTLACRTSGHELPVARGPGRQAPEPDQARRASPWRFPYRARLNLGDNDGVLIQHSQRTAFIARSRPRLSPTLDACTE